ncbi:MAG: FAD-dependent oxidoreductase [Gammaproteobacteria bacterium]|nr:FAD-dependent oxidoreductase [Gammaproteobacteria bacterium]
MASNDDEYDLIVIGGGIYGIMMALEASLRDLRVAIVERNEWGSGTTSAWLRIVHGGLRYLQTADLARYFESIRERRWFLRHFPDLVAPLPCIMPLYHGHSHPPILMWAALAVNDVLSMHRNRAVADANRIPSGSILSEEAVGEALPFAETDGLRGGARWFDAVVLEPQTLLLELLNWARDNGASASEHTEAIRLLHDNHSVQGLEVRDSQTGDLRQLRARVVINATGHWAPGLAGQFGAGFKSTPRASWAWNILFDVSNDAECAAALSARRSDSQMFFVLPWKGQTLVGTGHALIPQDLGDESVPDDLITKFVQQVSEAAPALNLTESAIARVYQGVLPASNRDKLKLASRPLIVDHGHTGITGFYTVWGIKYTTARDIARALIRKAFPDKRHVTVTYQRPN